MFVLAQLDDSQLQTLKHIEEEKGLTLLAFKDVDLEPAPIDAEKLGALKQLEDELGVCVLAVQE